MQGDNLRALVPFQVFNLGDALNLDSQQEGWEVRIATLTEDRMDLEITGPSELSSGSKTLEILCLLPSGRQTLFVDYYVKARPAKDQGRSR